MAKHERYPEIAGYHRKRIKDQFRALRKVPDEAMRYVAPLQLQYNAIFRPAPAVVAHAEHPKRSAGFIFLDSQEADRFCRGRTAITKETC